MLEKFAEFIPREITEKSGSVFYSGENAFKGEKKLYILGLNPGGSIEKQKDETIKKHTQSLIDNQNPNFSEYQDSIWRNKPAGTARLQKRVLHLLTKLDLSPYEVPASNVCFVRSSREKEIADKIKNYMDLCWDLHEKIIDELKIKVILCFGKTAGKFVKGKLNATEEIDFFEENNNRKWKSTVFRNQKNQYVIIATHPSIADWTSNEADISNLVKKYI